MTTSSANRRAISGAVTLTNRAGAEIEPMRL